MDGNVDAEGQFPCARCGTYMPFRGLHNHERACRKRHAEAKSDPAAAAAQRYDDNQQLSAKNNAELSFAQREWLLYRAAMAENHFATQRVMDMTSKSHRRFNATAAVVSASEIMSSMSTVPGVNLDAQYEAWLTAMLERVFDPSPAHTDHRSETRAIDEIIQPVWTPPLRTLGYNEFGVPEVVQVCCSLDGLVIHTHVFPGW